MDKKIINHLMIALSVVLLVAAIILLYLCMIQEKETMLNPALICILLVNVVNVARRNVTGEKSK